MKKQLIVLFLLVAQIVSAQTNKVERKINTVANKPHKNKVFTCNNIPKKDFTIGKYTVDLIEEQTTNSQYEYNVIKDDVLMARINVYENTIVQVRAIKNVDSFTQAVKELEKNGNALIYLTGEIWKKEILPYIKEIEGKDRKYLVSYKGNFYVIDTTNAIFIANR
jgi:hypothetical protein